MAVLLETPAAYTSPWHCEHPQTALRWRIRADKIGIWAEQCLQCGGQVRAVSKNDPRIRMLTERVAFDETIRQRWEQRATAVLERQRQAMEAEKNAQSAEWWKRYDAYLKTPAWRSKRAQVLERANGMCEGCRRRKAEQVHHLTYEHVGDEFLFELVAICNACHHRLHPDME
jgi:hypothetical protein